jgi:hypothetical protein
MRHPELPDNDPIEIAESAVPQHRSQGWEVIDPPANQEPKDEADGKAPRGESKTPRRPSVKKEQD